jgi:hypothetical protein
MISPISERNGDSPVEYTPPTFSRQAAATSDTVALSVTSQAIFLNQQGLSVSEISALLGVSNSLIQGDLGIAITDLQTTTAATA